MPLFDKRLSRNFDHIIFLNMLVIFIIGLAFLYSATFARESYGFVLRQTLWMCLALFSMLLVINIDYQRFIDGAFFFYAANIFLLAIVLVFGPMRYGARRWLELGPLNLQPSEFAKITLLLAVSYYLGHRRDSIKGIITVVTPFIILLPSFFLILVEPDLGTAIVLVPVIFAMLYVSGCRVKNIVALLGAGTAAMPFFWQLLKEYQKRRLLVFINPNMDPLGAGYTITQSKIAVGSGGLFGKGWLSGTQNQLNFLPERHTDFIFSVVGEEWGFFGSVILLGLYFVIIYRGLRIVSDTKDLYGKSLASGIVALLALQVVINIGMTIGLMPVVGMTLPLISYGGSSLYVTVILIGLLLNIGMRRPLL